MQFFCVSLATPMIHLVGIFLMKPVFKIDCSGLSAEVEGGQGKGKKRSLPLQQLVTNSFVGGGEGFSLPVLDKVV